MSSINNKPNSSPVDAAQELIAELHRNPDIIPSYNDELMQTAIDNMKELININQILFDAHKNNMNNEAYAKIMARQAVIDRIKRCICTYIEIRKQRLKKLRWKYYGMPPEEIRKNLSPSELNWIKNYTKMVSEYQLGFGKDGLNLMLHTKPPTNLLIQVKVLKDYGEFETSEGNVIVLKKNSLHQLPTIDCEGLIRQGVLEETGSANLSLG